MIILFFSKFDISRCRFGPVSSCIITTSLDGSAYVMILSRKTKAKKANYLNYHRLFIDQDKLNISKSKVCISLFFLFLAGLCEIGGGYLVWLWLREDMSWIYGIIGGFVLFLYGIVPTFQPSYFHRIYAAYGGIFIIMALLWGLIFEGIYPDLFDGIGAVIAIVGVVIIFYTPRKGEKPVWLK